MIHFDSNFIASPFGFLAASKANLVTKNNANDEREQGYKEGTADDLVYNPFIDIAQNKLLDRLAVNIRVGQLRSHQSVQTTITEKPVAKTETIGISISLRFGKIALQIQISRYHNSFLAKRANNTQPSIESL